MFQELFLISQCLSNTIWDSNFRIRDSGWNYQFFQDRNSLRMTLILAYCHAFMHQRGTEISYAIELSYINKRINIKKRRQTLA